jgi:hypothetical protein
MVEKIFTKKYYGKIYFITGIIIIEVFFENLKKRTLQPSTHPPFIICASDSKQRVYTSYNYTTIIPLLLLIINFKKNNNNNYNNSNII